MPVTPSKALSSGRMTAMPSVCAAGARPGQTVVNGSGVSVRIAARPVLQDCSFDFPAGQFTCILGPNGAGKTSLLGVCNGLVRLSSGSLVVFGEQLGPRNAVSLRKRIGYVAQWRVIDPRQPISVFESVLSGTYGKLGLFRSPKDPERKLAWQALEAVSATRLAERPLGHLSGGESQRVAIARALAQQPELLLLDEPTASLDWQARRDILSLIGELRQKYALSIVMVTHELNALAELCEHALFMKEGRIVWQGPGHAALDSERLSQLFDTPVKIIDNEGLPLVLL